MSERAQFCARDGLQEKQMLVGEGLLFKSLDDVRSVVSIDFWPALNQDTSCILTFCLHCMRRDNWKATLRHYRGKVRKQPLIWGDMLFCVANSL